MVGPIDVQNVILNATSQSQVNSNSLAQAAVGEAFRGIMSKKEEEVKATQINETEHETNNAIDEKKEHHRKKRQKKGHIDLKA
jgi:hypothetical protein